MSSSKSSTVSYQLLNSSQLHRFDMSTETKPLVFVTGASGFLGFEVVYQLLQAGYPVRGAARGRKVSLLKKAFEKYPQFEAVEVADVASGDFSTAFDGVGAIIHTAAPLPGRADGETALKSAVEGSLHILREARKAGVKKFVATGSTVTFPENAYGPNDWVPVTKEQALEGNAFVLYIAEKKFGEQAVLAFAEEHPEIDITVYLSPTQPLILLRADNVNYNYSPGMLDVRDVARVHIAGLNPLTADHPRRVPVISQYPNDWREAIRFISEARPELRARLADPSKAPVWTTPRAAFGIKLDSYKTWKETILDAVDRFIDLENQWKAKGLKFEVPTAPPM
ncbi:NAD(P)-binding protein [Mycena olivaceomarginata]|nr:NAD(P)-binding protein [Mycena olivaceomarginata]